MDQVREPEKIEFRDGTRLVPAYLANLMNDLETHKMTYEEARQEANSRMSRDYVNSKFESIIKSHFRGR